MEPRDLNPTGKIRANHIVGRVLRLNPEVATQQLMDVLDSFEGCHRNLIDIAALLKLVPLSSAARYGVVDNDRQILQHRH
jgi:hypothetical protein